MKVRNLFSILYFWPVWPVCLAASLPRCTVWVATMLQPGRYNFR